MNADTEVVELPSLVVDGGNINTDVSGSAASWEDSGGGSESRRPSLIGWSTMAIPLATEEGNWVVFGGTKFTKLLRFSGM